MFLQSNSLSVGQRQETIIVHHRVHVLHPQCINITIKQDVLALVLIVGPIDLAEDVGQQTIGPVTSDWVQDTIQLYDTHGLGVHDVDLSGYTESVWVQKWKRFKSSIHK